ncbi:MAG: glycosyltransferase, partial [Armatimonadetes bacterium]|nr:glycosyltransferase [Armatimonadota bacterium]
MSKRRNTATRRKKSLDKSRRNPSENACRKQDDLPSIRHDHTAAPLKLHLGCGYKILNGYINIDLYSPAADLKLDITDLSPFADSTVDEIYLNAVFEHLYIFEQRRALAEWRRVLKPGGKLIIHSIPDFDEIVRAYINRAPGNDGDTFDIEEVSRYTHGAYGPHDKLGQIHKDVFTKRKMRNLLERAGFEVISIENVCWGDEPNPVNMNITAVKVAEVRKSVIHPTPDEETDYARLYAPLGSNHPKFAAVYCVYDDDAWLADSVESIYDACDAVYVLISSRPWHGEPTDNSMLIETVHRLNDPHRKIRLVQGTWQTEAEQRNAGLEILRNDGFDYCLVIDADEVYDTTDLKRMMRLVAKYRDVDCWHVEMDTYWKSWRYRIAPREPLKPPVFLKVDRRFTENRNVEDCKRGLIPPDVGICHHLSYARTDDQLLRKISTFSHANEVRDGWYENVWKRWDIDPSLRNLHPTHPTAYQRAIPQPYWALPPVLRRRHNSELAHRDEIDKPIVSIIVLVRNQLDYTRRCLESIDRHTPEPHEVIVVDNGSSDGTVKFLETWSSKGSGRKVIRNDKNLGFAKGNNLGISTATGEYVLLLNNDVVVTPGWIERMLACAARDSAIGVVGPVSNAVSGPQYVDQPLYETESLQGLDEFAEEWAAKHARQTVRVWRVVGFCMLIRRSVIDKIGGLDECYRLGNFEDDDFCIRATLAGFKIVIARDCFVHHYGSRTFAGEGIDFRNLMAENWKRFKEKWGFPKELRLESGYDLAPVLQRGFDPRLHYTPLPSAVGPQATNTNDKHESKAVSPEKPLLSLCIIARDEEGFLPGCLESARDVVDEIVLVDTGSTDRTLEIARSFGADVYRFEWNDNYSDARNEAIKHARGDWILFLDADERLDQGSKSKLREAVEKPSADAYELVFYNYCGGPVSSLSTSRDTDEKTMPEGQPEIVHRVCRLHRNRPDYRYQGRIHENVVPSIISAGGTVAELDVIVRHYGYQPEVKKQRNKDERYIKLLHKELDEKPGDIYVLSHIGAAYCAKGEFEKALPYLEKLTSVAPTDHAFTPQAFSRLANAYWALGRHEDSLATAENALKKGIVHPEIHYAKGNALLALGEYEDAISAFEKAIDIGTSREWLGDPGVYSYKAIFGIARAWIGIGDYAKAAEYCEKVVAERPDHVQAREVLALAYTHLGLLQDAVKHWTALIGQTPDRAEAHYKLAGCLEALGQIASAEHHYLQAIDIDPSFAEALNDLGRLYAAQNKVEESMDCFVRAVEARPDYANAYFNAGD